MWTITDEQLTNISHSMRIEFEERAYYVLSKEDCTDRMTEAEIKSIISRQIDRIMPFGFKNEDHILNFIQLSFKYSDLQVETLSDPLSNILLSNDSEAMKIENLNNLLKNNDYVF